MLRFLRRGQRWMTLALVIGIGGVFVFFMGFQGSFQPSVGNATLVQVGSYAFGFREFEQARASREQDIKRQIGDGYDADAWRDNLDRITAQSLVNRAILALEAEATGPHGDQRSLNEVLKPADVSWPLVAL